MLHTPGNVLDVGELNLAPFYLAARFARLTAKLYHPISDLKSSSRTVATVPEGV